MAIAELGVNLVANTSSFNRTMSQVSKEMKKIGKGFSDVGTQITKITAPLAVLGGMGIKSSIELEKAYNKIRVGTGAVGKDLENLKSDFKEVFKNVPDSADKVSSAIADLNTRTGLSGEALQDLAKKTLDLSRITGEDLGSVIQSTTRLFGDWGIEAEKGGDTLDFLFKVSQSTGIGINDLSTKMVAFGAPLRNMGFGFEESAALMGKFEKEGVNLELVVGSLRQAMAKFTEAGISANDGLKSVMQSIKDAKDPTEATGIAFEVFGRRAGGDMADAIRGGRFEIDELLESLSNSEETIGKATKETETFSEKLGKLRNSAMIALEPIGKFIIDNLIPIFEKLSKTIQSLGEWFAGLSKTSQGVVTVFGMIAVAAGPVLLVLGKLITSLGILYPAIITTAKSFVILAGATGIGALAIALGAVAVGLYVFRDDVAKVFDYIFEKIDKLLSYIPLLNNFSTQLSGVAKEQTNLEQATKKVREEADLFVRSIAAQTGALDKLKSKEGELVGETEKIRESLKKLKAQGLENTKVYQEQIKKLQHIQVAKTAVTKKITELSSATKDQTKEVKDNSNANIDNKKTTDSYKDAVDKLAKKKKEESEAEKEANRIKREAEKTTEKLEDAYKELEEVLTGKTNKAIEEFKNKIDDIITQNPGVPIANLSEEFKILYQKAVEANVPIAELTKKIEEVKKNKWDGGFFDGFFDIPEGSIGEGIGQKIGEDIANAISSAIKEIFQIMQNGGDSEDYKNLAKNIGSTIGGAIGTYFGGPVGKEIGAGVFGYMFENAFDIGEAIIEGRSQDLRKVLEKEMKWAEPGLNLIMGSENLLDIHTFGLIGGKDKQANARAVLEDFFDDLIKTAREKGIELQSFLNDDFSLIDGRDAFTPFVNAAGETTTAVTEKFKELPPEMQVIFNDLGIAFEQFFGEIDVASGQTGQLLGVNFKSLNDLQLLLQSSGLTVEQFTAQLEKAYLEGKISAEDYLKSANQIEKVMAQGIPDGIGRTDLAVKNLRDGGLKSGAIALDSFGDIAVEMAEKGITSFADMEKELLNLGWSAEEVEAFMTGLAKAGIKDMEDLKNVTAKQSAIIISTMKDMGFAFSDVGDEIKDIKKNLDEIKSKKITIDVDVNYKEKGDVPKDKDVNPVPNARGNVISGGDIVRYARGGIVSSPTLFPMAKGTGLMGEAGPEAIIPLTRKSNGELGIETEGMTKGDTFNINIDAKGAEIGFAKKIRQEIENFFDARNTLIGART